MRKPIIYADNAATTKLDKAAYEAMQLFLQEEYANASQPYSFARSAKAALRDARLAIAECINADPSEIYFTSGGTESDNWAIKGSMFAYGDHRCMLTSAIEHHAVLNSCAAVEKMGYTVVYLPVENDGIVFPDTLKQYITNQTKLVSVMLANNEIGSIQPIKELCCIAHEHGAVFHTDAVQAVGHIPVDVSDLGVDMLSASAHKFGGPKGVGFLYIKKGTTISPYLNGGSQEMKMRAGTENIAGIVGMAAALSKRCSSIEHSTNHLFALTERFKSRIAAAGVDYVLNGSTNHLPGHISISFKNVTGEQLLHRLDLMGIIVSTGAACDSVSTEISHVLQAIYVPSEYIKGTIRLSFSTDNTIEEVDQIVASLVRILKC